MVYYPIVGTLTLVITSVQGFSRHIHPIQPSDTIIFKYDRRCITREQISNRKKYGNHEDFYYC